MNDNIKYNNLTYKETRSFPGYHNITIELSAEVDNSDPVGLSFAYTILRTKVRGLINHAANVDGLSEGEIFQVVRFVDNVNVKNDPQFVTEEYKTFVVIEEEDNGSSKQAYVVRSTWRKITSITERALNHYIVHRSFNVTEDAVKYCLDDLWGERDVRFTVLNDSDEFEDLSEIIPF